MPKPHAGTPSPLVEAAAAVDRELREYDEIAHEASRIELDGERSLARAARTLEQATSRQPRIQEKLQRLVSEIEQARTRQQRSLDALVEVSRALQARAERFDAIMRRFAALGEAAHAVNELTSRLAARREAGAPDPELLERLRELDDRMKDVVTEAEQLASDAAQDHWPEVARQADAIRQQMNAARNKIALAQRTVASRAPS